VHSPGIVHSLTGCGHNRAKLAMPGVTMLTSVRGKEGAARALSPRILPALLNLPDRTGGMVGGLPGRRAPYRSFGFVERIKNAEIHIQRGGKGYKCRKCRAGFHDQILDCFSFQAFAKPLFDVPSG
jgi:hypothetical protein